MLLALDVGRDGTRIPAAGVETVLETLCGSGNALACHAADAPRGDVGALAKRLAPACEAGEADACVVQAWSLLPDGPAGLELAPSDPVRFRTLVEAACEAGSARGCTELAYVHLHGIATYVSPPQAQRRLTHACDAGEAHACTALGRLYDDDDPRLAETFERARELGDPTALVELAALRPDEAPDLLREACERGAGTACRPSAVRLLDTDPAAAIALLDEACAVGHTDACVSQAVARAAAGELPVDEAIAQLDAHCAQAAWACEEASFLRSGAPPRLDAPGGYGLRTDLPRHVADAEPAVHDCLKQALARGDTPGPVRVVWRLSPEGAIEGMYVAEAPDEALGTCVADAVRAVRFRPPEGGAARFEHTFPMGHEARIKIDSLVGLDGGEMAAVVAADTPAWAGPLEDCYVAHDDPLHDGTLEVDFTLRRSGAIDKLTAPDPSATSTATWACLVRWMSQHRVPDAHFVPTRLRARIRFVQPAASPEEVEDDAVIASTDVVGEVRPVTVRMLVLVVQKSRGSAGRGRFDAGGVASVRAAHEAMAAFVEEQTGGQVRIAWELREVSGPASTGSFDDQGGAARWVLDLDDLSIPTLASVEPGKWDSVFIWAPVPRGFPRPALGITHTGLTLRGATVSMGGIPSGSELLANPGSPPFELPLHEWWHQVEVRAENLLGLEWVPSNHRVLRMGDRVLNPRTWVTESDTVVDWYEEVLSRHIHPELWRDVWSRPRGLEVAGENHAADGWPWGEGITWPEPLNDGLVTMRGFLDVVELDEEDAETDEPWFGIEWPWEKRTCSRVVAHVGSREDPNAPSMASVHVDVMADPRGDGTWSRAETVDVDGPLVEVDLGGRACFGVRLRVGKRVKDVTPAVREIAAF